MGVQKRIDPTDGAAYTYAEIVQFYKSKYTKTAVQEYWGKMRPQTHKVWAAAGSERERNNKPKTRKANAPSLSQDIVGRLAKIFLSEERVKELCAIDELADDVLAWGVSHGVVMYRKPACKSQANAVPITLLPSPFDANLYQEVKQMGPDFHRVMDRVSLDLPWLKEALEKTGKLDVICGRLLAICDRVYGTHGSGKKDHAKDIRVHVMRNDFMLDTRIGAEGFAATQIELNMIAASFSTHGQDLTEIHRYVLKKYLQRLDPELTPEALQPVLAQLLPSSPNSSGIARALAQAHNAYVQRWRPTQKQRVVLFVAGEEEKNELDHRKLEVALFKVHGILTIRRSLAALGAQLDTLLVEVEPAAGQKGSDAPDAPAPKAFIVDGYEVTVAYFREGYWPGHFDPLEKCWAAREALEIAEAAKCPSAPAQLAGMKKVQQLLCKPSELERFADKAVGERLSRTFAQQCDPSEDSEDARAITKSAEDNPAVWVMKPQVEGSGDLIFDKDITNMIKSKSREELAEYILMKRIVPAVSASGVFIVEDDSRAKVVVRRSVAELGIFGTFVAVGSRVLRNETFGHLLRSKGKDTTQGGVFVGNAVVDAPLLLPPELFWPSTSSS
mmetsp:Transcript_12759/g.28185  ORF Transcript_12759/g.28185 Transcript_12759/m.28185 type:complete len:614 (+) Transcript_12759:26-1867(+)|eukprot:CAMPEP_0170638442 /NCGR_PEP_ID=MMETSP0224-20130122/39034_1 /TAXON_ID=285029 /ORGANISM="Togula jolla, Strain CCCM 725" /LENGTH=613 /DNA_ID=CAMNT_0010968563 /DNA_START=24 /DNA_END=1865 /DNA_ORIENTATION=+